MASLNIRVASILFNSTRTLATTEKSTPDINFKISGIFVNIKRSSSLIYYFTFRVLLVVLRKPFVIVNEMLGSLYLDKNDTTLNTYLIAIYVQVTPN